MTPLYVYAPTKSTDLLMTQLWARMDADGDLDKIFSDPDYPLSAFLKSIAPPNETIYAVDDAGVYFLVWFERFATGTFLSAYFRPDHRRTMHTYNLFRRVLKSGIDAYGTILNMTWQPTLAGVHEALGYVYIGTVPKLFRGRDAMLFSCNAESYAAADMEALRKRRSARRLEVVNG